MSRAVCNSRCTGAKSPRSACRCSCGGANHGGGRLHRERTGPAPVRLMLTEIPTDALDRAIRKIGLSVIRGAAVGVACGAIPAACPAILAINQAAGLAQVASDVYQAYSSGQSRRVSLNRAAGKAGQALISMSIGKTIQEGAEEELRGVSRAVGAAVGAGTGAMFGANHELVRTIAAETTYCAMEEGIEGVVSWG